MDSEKDKLLNYCRTFNVELPPLSKAEVMAIQMEDEKESMGEVYEYEANNLDSDDKWAIIETLWFYFRYTFYHAWLDAPGDLDKYPELEREFNKRAFYIIQNNIHS